MERILSLLALVVLTAAYEPVGASAEPIRQPETGRCLDSNANGKGDGEPGAVYTLPCNSGHFQDWVFDGDTIRHPLTGRCLDSNANGKGDRDGGDVYTLPCNGTDFQKWQFGFGVETGNYTLYLVGKAPHKGVGGIAVQIRQPRTDRCLDGSVDAKGHGNVYTLPCQESPFQNWAAESQQGPVRALIRKTGHGGCIHWKSFNTTRGSLRNGCLDG